MKEGATDAFEKMINALSSEDIEKAKDNMREVFSEFAQKYWSKFDEAIVSVFSNADEAIKFIKDGQSNYSDEKWAKIREAMKKSITNKEDRKLTYQENLALNLKFLELQLIAQGSNDFMITLKTDYSNTDFEQLFAASKDSSTKGDFKGLGVLT